MTNEQTLILAIILRISIPIIIIFAIIYFYIKKGKVKK